MYSRQEVRGLEKEVRPGKGRERSGHQEKCPRDNVSPGYKEYGTEDRKSR